MTDDIFRRATDNMKNAINALPENQKKFLLEYEPREDRGYLWDENPNYKQIKDILSIKTDSDGHSGASFSVCLRGAIKELRPPIIQGTEVCTKDTENSEIVTLKPM